MIFCISKTWPYFECPCIGATAYCTFDTRNFDVQSQQDKARHKSLSLEVFFKAFFSKGAYILHEKRLEFLNLMNRLQ